VRRKPYSVVLLDEIEKAHPDVFNILLQILEDGKLTDAQGRKVDFRNTIVIMTSNIGASTISKNQTLGFSVGDDSGLSYEEMKDRIMGELKKVFRPELLNRIDEVIVFHKLTKEEIMLIVELLMKRLRDQIGEKGYDPTMGARPLRRAIQRFIEDPLADFVLGRSLEPGSTILIDRKNDDEVDITVIPAEITPEKVTVPPDEPTDSADDDSE
jgi:ATP-dependent Clp protease ATP-binding subunit ClpC